MTPQITFRHVPPSPALEEAIREKAAKLDQFCDHIMGCRVVVEAPQHRHHRGNLYNLRIDVTVPGGELVVTRNPSQRHAHEDMYVVIRDAFDAMRRQLEDYVREERGAVKTHTEPARARVSRLFPEAGYGFLSTPDAREIYFHRNSVVDTPFEKLAIGDEVQFTEASGEKGPQATSVQAARRRRSRAPLASRGTSHGE
jgi:ribosomal subunit interface protein